MPLIPNFYVSEKQLSSMGHVCPFFQLDCSNLMLKSVKKTLDLSKFLKKLSLNGSGMS